MIGRTKEQNELNEMYCREGAEFIAVYGRRRVGKTYLIDETFSNRITFRHAGLSPSDDDSNRSPMKAQLQAFYYSLLQHGMKKSHCPKDWLEAFFMLETLLQSKDDGGRQLVFLDELPWMDTARSSFITALENFWNGWGCHRKNLMLIVCGSSNSWILNKLINNHGGLFNRVTHEIKLEPFTLRECEECADNRNVQLSRYDLTQAYMILGGIPFYWNYMQSGKSLAQNIDELFFMKSAKLNQEYQRLFSSVFSNPEQARKIVEFLARRSFGYTRTDISENTGISNGSMLSDFLNALVASDFVTRYIPFGGSKREEYYRLSDPFCIFYLRFVRNHDSLDETFWMDNLCSQSVVTWRGLAFENVCFNHIRQIKKALGISGISTKQSAWSKKDDKERGTQIDLVIERKDNVVNMCEIKFYGTEFVVDKDYDRELRHRKSLLSAELSRKQVVHSILITTYGLKYNQYSGDFAAVVVLDDLF